MIHGTRNTPDKRAAALQTDCN